MFSRLLFLLGGLQLRLLSLALSPPLRAPLLLSSILLLLPFAFLLVDLLRDREPEALERLLVRLWLRLLRDLLLLERDLEALRE